MVHYQVLWEAHVRGVLTQQTCPDAVEGARPGQARRQQPGPISKRVVANGLRSTTQSGGSSARKGH
jgi:hypothetical protein